MTQVAAANTDGVTNAPHPRPPTPRTGFHVLLAELNPLQYVPVLGTLYRALTGDRIPEEARTVGSLVVSGIMGGPVGVAIGVAETAVEKMTGIDPERLGTRLLASIGIGNAKPHATPRARVAGAGRAAGAPHRGLVTGATGRLRRNLRPRLPEARKSAGQRRAEQPGDRPPGPVRPAVPYRAGRDGRRAPCVTPPASGKERPPALRKPSVSVERHPLTRNTSSRVEM